MILLFINSIMFILTVKEFLNFEKAKRPLNVTGGQKSKEADKFFMFLKLFLGMGILWVFEVIAGLCGDLTSEKVW